EASSRTGAVLHQPAAGPPLRRLHPRSGGLGRLRALSRTERGRGILPRALATWTSHRLGRRALGARGDGGGLPRMGAAAAPGANADHRKSAVRAASGARVFVLAACLHVQRGRGLHTPAQLQQVHLSEPGDRQLPPARRLRLFGLLSAGPRIAVGENRVSGVGAPGRVALAGATTRLAPGFRDAALSSVPRRPTPLGGDPSRVRVRHRPSGRGLPAEALARGPQREPVVRPSPDRRRPRAVPAGRLRLPRRHEHGPQEPLEARHRHRLPSGRGRRRRYSRKPL
ncbi:MAG: hypothetical protein AVDCRST_MAG50-1760, partial [uncultured Acidimicrobiales bacterium]